MERLQGRLLRGVASSASSSRTPTCSPGTPSPTTSRSRCGFAGTASRIGGPGPTSSPNSSVSRDSRTPIPRELSGGMRQRVAIARALSIRPEAAADGRAVRRARRAHPGTNEPGVAAHRAGDQGDGRLRHPRHHRGRLPRRPGGASDAAARRIQQITTIDIAGRAASTCRPSRSSARSCATCATRSTRRNDQWHGKLIQGTACPGSARRIILVVFFGLGVFVRVSRSLSWSCRRRRQVFESLVEVLGDPATWNHARVTASRPSAAS